MHRVLERQLRKLGLSLDEAPASAEQWTALLARVSRSYTDADEDRYTLERSIELSSAEMKSLHARLASERDKLRSIFESAALGIVRFDADGRVVDANPATLSMFGTTRDELEGRPVASLFEDAPAPAKRSAADSPMSVRRSPPIVVAGERTHRGPDGSIVWIHVTTNWVRDPSGAPTFGTATLENVTVRKLLEGSLRHAQKLESVGRLAAGVAHEINTPIQFVCDNVHFLKSALETMTAMIAQQRAIVAGAPADIATAHTAAAEAADLSYLVAEVPRAVAETLDGLQRVATIVQSMKVFAHADRDKKQSPVDVNAAILSTLTVARHELAGVAETVTDLGDIPPVLAYPGDLSQVFLNLFVNAAHAIGDVVEGTDKLGLITVTTRRIGDDVVLSIADTGGGIPEEVQRHLFEPFFTTKPVGKGSGQGLALARAIVVDKHEGALTVETSIGAGTTFFVRLPIQGSQKSQSDAA